MFTWLHPQRKFDTDLIDITMTVYTAHMQEHNKPLYIHTCTLLAWIRATHKHTHRPRHLDNEVLCIAVWSCLLQVVGSGIWSLQTI